MSPGRVCGISPHKWVGKVIDFEKHARRSAGTVPRGMVERRWRSACRNDSSRHPRIGLAHPVSWRRAWWWCPCRIVGNTRAGPPRPHPLAWCPRRDSCGHLHGDCSLACTPSSPPTPTRHSKLVARWVERQLSAKGLNRGESQGQSPYSRVRATCRHAQASATRATVNDSETKHSAALVVEPGDGHFGHQFTPGAACDSRIGGCRSAMNGAAPSKTPR